MPAAVSPLIDVATLARNADRCRVLDASWIYPPFNAAGIDVRARWAEAHIPDSLFLDLASLSAERPGDVADVPAIAPPTAASLRTALARAGIVFTTPLVVTDQDGGTTTAPLARLALLAAGFGDVRLLDGGTPAWTAAGHPLTAADPLFVNAPRLGGTPLAGRLVGTRATAAAVASDTASVLDARFVAENRDVLPGRFRDVVIPAHVVLRPGEVTEETAGGTRFRSPTAIAAIATERGLTPERHSIATCHFGLGAAVVATALELAGFADVSVDTDSILGWARVQAASG